MSLTKSGTIIRKKSRLVLTTWKIECLSIKKPQSIQTEVGNNVAPPIAIGATLPSVWDSSFRSLIKHKSRSLWIGFIIMWRRPTLPGVTPVPSALQGLTSLFGMGRGGTPALGRLNLNVR